MHQTTGHGIGPMDAASSLPYRLVVFDLDGTLADSFSFFLACQGRLAAMHGFRALAGDEVEEARGWSARQLMRHAGLPFWKLPRVARDFRRMMETDGGAIACFPGVPETLGRLHAAGVKLALVTSNSMPNSRRVLGPETWALLSHVECGASMFGKARRLRRACKAARVAPREAIYIGDQTVDGEAARAAGMAFGAAGWGYATAESLARLSPELCLDEVAQLAEIAVRR